MRIAQISDFHFTHLTWNPLRLMNKRIFGNLNWLFSRKGHYSQAPLQHLPTLFDQLGVDLVLLGGDFTTTSLPEEFEEAKRFIDQIRQPWIAIPGNHDHYTYSAYRTGQYYQYFSNPGQTALREKKLEIHPLSPEWTLIALDTARPRPPSSSEGLMSEALEQEITHALATLPPEQSVILFNHYPFLENDEEHRNLERSEALEALLRKHPQIRLYMHGHTHRNTIADLQPNNLPVVLDGGSSAEGYWNLVDIDSKGCIVEAYQWDNSSWTPFRKEEILWTR